MARHAGAVLVDTNIIFESFRIRAWRALSSSYALETVEDCVTETQTGFQRRRAEQRIDAAELRAKLSKVHATGDAERAVLAVLAPDIALDVGERSLWAHAINRSDGWVLCGPDKASLRLGVRLGYRDRLVALEWLLSEAGYRPKPDLKVAYTARWLETTLSQLVLAEGLGRT